MSSAGEVAESTAIPPQPSVLDVTTRVLKLVGAVHGNLAILRQHPVTYELLIWVNNWPVLVNVDVIDRWNRELGQVDLARYLGVAVGLANPVHTQIVVGGAVVDPRDVIDRAARLLGVIYGNQAQLQQVPATLELITQDTGLHTNPRRYEKVNGIFSAPIARAGGVATALWTTVTARPRTAGRSTTIYTLIIENPTGASVSAWLEIGGVAITPKYYIVTMETDVITFAAGLTTGNNDVNCNASANAVVFQVIGTEV